MATIRPNDNAPSEKVTYLLPTASFDLAKGDSYETEDRALTADAAEHPWLEVEFPEALDFRAEERVTSVPYADDVLAAHNSVAFDIEAIKKTEAEKRGDSVTPTAIEAGLDQTEAVEEGGVALTLEEASTEASTNDKPAPKKRGTKEN